MEKKLPLTTVFAGRTNDVPAMFALGLVETVLHPRIVERVSLMKSAPLGSVGFVTTNGSERVRYSSRNFRVLRSDAAEGTRGHTERFGVISMHAWLVPASLIVCLNPVRLDSETGVWVNRGRERNLDALMNALRGLCHDYPEKEDPLSNLSPQEKADLRIGARRQERRKEHTLGR